MSTQIDPLAAPSWDFAGREQGHALAKAAIDAEVERDRIKGVESQKLRKRQPKNGEKRRTVQAKQVGKRKRNRTNVADPWNGMRSKMRLFVCESVREQLPVYSKYR